MTRRPQGLRQRLNRIREDLRRMRAERATGATPDERAAAKQVPTGETHAER